MTITTEKSRITISPRLLVVYIDNNLKSIRMVGAFYSNHIVARGKKVWLYYHDKFFSTLPSLSISFLKTLVEEQKLSVPEVFQDKKLFYYRKLSGYLEEHPKNFPLVILSRGLLFDEFFAQLALGTLPKDVMFCLGQTDDAIMPGVGEKQ